RLLSGTVLWGNWVPAVSEPLIELGTDTTRTIASLLFSGSAEQSPDIKWIFSHAGGTAPFLMQRFTFYFAARKDLQPRLPRGPAYYMERFYYDTANAMTLHPIGHQADALHLEGIERVLDLAKGTVNIRKRHGREHPASRVSFLAISTPRESSPARPTSSAPRSLPTILAGSFLTGKATAAGLRGKSVPNRICVGATSLVSVYTTALRRFSSSIT